MLCLCFNRLKEIHSMTSSRTVFSLLFASILSLAWPAAQAQVLAPSQWGLGVGLDRKPYRDFDNDVQALPLLLFENRYVSFFGAALDLATTMSAPLSRCSGAPSAPRRGGILRRDWQLSDGRCLAQSCQHCVQTLLHGIAQDRIEQRRDVAKAVRNAFYQDVEMVLRIGVRDKTETQVILQHGFERGCAPASLHPLAIVRPLQIDEQRSLRSSHRRFPSSPTGCAPWDCPFATVPGRAPARPCRACRARGKRPGTGRR